MWSAAKDCSLYLLRASTLKCKKYPIVLGFGSPFSSCASGFICLSPISSVSWFCIPSSFSLTLRFAVCVVISEKFLLGAIFCYFELVMLGIEYLLPFYFNKQYFLSHVGLKSLGHPDLLTFILTSILCVTVPFFSCSSSSSVYSKILPISWFAFRPVSDINCPKNVLNVVFT